MPRQAFCGPTHCTNRVLSVLNIEKESESTKAEQKMQGGYSKKKEKKKSNSDTPGWPTVTNLGRKGEKRWCNNKAHTVSRPINLYFQR